MLTNFFCCSSFFLASASFLCFRAAFHKGSFRLSSSSGSVGVSAVRVLVTDVVIFVVVVVSTLVAAGFPFAAIGFPIEVTTSSVLTASLVATALLGVNATFIVTGLLIGSFVVVSVAVTVVPSFIALISSSGITRPKLHYKMTV